MSKINQIQQALREMDGGEFQKLADAYLAEKGFERINSIGSVIAANKVRSGTPDTLVVLPDGKYIFAEYTTQQTGLLDKLKADLYKCFDESKTGIPIEKIERVVLCFTGKLDASEENELTETCQEKGVKLDSFGIDTLAFDLYRNYPALARDFLGVHIDTGQIVSPEQFVSLYNRNKLATPLDLGFHFREEELDLLLNVLEGERLVILAGRAGIGKSRLALEVCGRFSEAHPEYEVLCVFGRNRDLWEDIQTRFARPGHFLILVDDANRVNGFKYIIDLLQHQREDQRIKVVATVRDYALAKIQKAAQSLGRNSEVELRPFTDEQIKGLITDEYGIRNYHYLERIVDIARGIPRLAVMMAEVAKEGSLSSIHDVSALYDTYFSSIREDLSDDGVDPGRADLLRVAAIVSFFKAVDRTNEEMMNDIEEAFGIIPRAFWEAADRLHDIEVLDMHDNEVVRVSDQVLGTYLFYLASFKERILDFGAFLKHFFPKLRHRLIDSINPVLNAFDSELIIDVMCPHVERVWKELEEKGDKESLLHLLDVFWFTKRTDTLLWVRDRIDELEAEAVEITSISFAKDSNAVPSPSILSLLRLFASVGKDEAQMALDLMSRYLAKRVTEAPVILRMLFDDYGFKPDSYLRRFEIQYAVIDELWSRAENGDPLFSRIFIAVSQHYLGTYFESYGMKDDRVLQIHRFKLPVMPDLMALRKAIWQRLFTLDKQEDLRDDVLGIISHYSQPSFRATNSEVVRIDAESVLPFLQSRLNPSSYLHCTIMHDYLDLLEEHDGEVPAGLRDQFYNNSCALAEILLTKRGERKELGLPYEAYEQYKQNQLKEYTADYSLDDYARFFDLCLEIQEALERQNEYQLQRGGMNALLFLADRDSNLYGEVLEQYLERGDPLRLNGSDLVQKLVEQQGRDGAFQLLLKPEYPTKRRWLFYVHEVLPADDVDEGMLAHLYELYGAAEGADLPYRLDYLLKYLPLDEQVITKVVSKVLEKVEADPGLAYTLAMLFNLHGETIKRMSEFFAEDLDLLKRAYMVVEATPHHSDYEGQVFDRLLDIDPSFIVEYIAWKYSQTEHRWLSSYDDHRDYAFIWARHDYQDIMDKVVESVYRHEKDGSFFLHSYLNLFFQIGDDGSEAGGEMRDRQDAYLLRLIDERNDDADFMKYLFGVIAHFSLERRSKFIERFIQQNRSFEAFKQLPSEPKFRSSDGSGSWIPVLQRYVSYWELLLPIMNTVDLLPHKQYVERYVQTLRAEIEQEKKNDFIGD